jgi:hypothetical protein
VGLDARRIIAITQLARGGPGKDYAAKLHDCAANLDRPVILLAGSHGRRNTLEMRGCGDCVVFGGLCSIW